MKNIKTRPAQCCDNCQYNVYHGETFNEDEDWFCDFDRTFLKEKISEKADDRKTLDKQEKWKDNHRVEETDICDNYKKENPDAIVYI